MLSYFSCSYAIKKLKRDFVKNVKLYDNEYESIYVKTSGEVGLEHLY